jgi:hypothetical protein
MPATKPQPKWTLEVGALPQVPGLVRLALEGSLREIAAVADELPPGSLARHALRGESLHLHLSGWRFAYEVDVDERRLRVLEAVRP